MIDPKSARRGLFLVFLILFLDVMGIAIIMPVLPAYLEELEAALARACPQAALAVFGHVADGNLHLIVGKAGKGHHALVDDIVYSPLQRVGGSISAEHGIGLEKLEFLHFSRSEAELEMMKRLKATLDPNSILNPGKVIPNI